MEWLRAVSGLASFIGLVIAVALVLVVLHAAPAFFRSAARRRMIRQWLPALDAIVILGAVFTMIASAGADRNTLLIATAVTAALILWWLRFALDDFVSGIVLQAELTIEPDSWLRIGGTEGRVRRIGLRSIVLETEQGDRVIVPFGMAARSAVVTSSAPDQTRAHTFSVTAPASTGADRAAAALRAAAFNSLWSSIRRDPEIELRAETAESLQFDVTVHALADDRALDIEREVRRRAAESWDDRK